MLSYGVFALVKSVTKDLKEDFLAVYDSSDVYAMIFWVTLKVIKLAIMTTQMVAQYQQTFMVCVA